MSDKINGKTLEEISEVYDRLSSGYLARVEEAEVRVHDLERAWGQERRGLMDRINELVERACKAEARMEAVREERDCARQEACAFAAAIRNQVKIGSATWQDVAIESGWSYLIATPTPGEGGEMTESEKCIHCGMVATGYRYYDEGTGRYECADCIVKERDELKATVEAAWEWVEITSPEELSGEYGAYSRGCNDVRKDIRTILTTPPTKED